MLSANEFITDSNSAEKLKNLTSELTELKIQSWQELSKFLQDLHRLNKKYRYNKGFSIFNSELDKGFAFVTFEFGADGVSSEIIKYIRVTKKLFPNTILHIIGGEFNEVFDKSLPCCCKHYKVDGMTGFGKWPLYNTLFKSSLPKKDQVQAEICQMIWYQSVNLVRKIGNYLLDNDIGLIYTVNTNSNPGNIALALSLVIVSEFLRIPVVNNNHDFFWECGRIANVEKYRQGRSGSRDIYFTNYHLPFFFSVLEELYPWRSKLWLQLNINHRKSRLLIKNHGFQQNDVCEIGTAIDVNVFKPFESENRRNTVTDQMNFLFRKQFNNTGITAIDDLLQKPVTADMEPLVTGFKTGMEFDFKQKNMIFLQPTRIIERKRIEDIFQVLAALMQNKEFLYKFMENSFKRLILLVSGPIIIGHENYFLLILKHFKELLSLLPQKYRDTVFLGFMFSCIDKLKYCRRFKNPIKMNDLFNLADMITLASETEGRGLPIIEAAACQVPIITRRYYPEEVYAQTIGENLSDSEKLKVIEFKQEIDKQFIKNVNDHLFSNIDLLHNRIVAEKRFNFPHLQRDLKSAINKLYKKMNN